MVEIVFLLFLLGTYLYGLYYSVDNKDKYLSLYNTNQLKGFFALIIIFHHLTQNIYGDEGLVLHNAGYIGVAVFFFFNGYGLMYKLKNDENYLKGFFRKRLLKILYPFLMVYALGMILDWIQGNPHSISEIIKSFINGHPLVSGSWYVIFILLFYLFFWAAAVFFKRNPVKVIIASGCFLVIWIVFCIFRKFGQVWFISCLSILLGMCWDYIDNKIEVLAEKKSRYVYFSAMIIIFIFLHSLYSGALHGTYKGFFIAMLSSTVFAFLIMVLNYYLQNKGPVLNFFGKISFEFYLIHTLFISLLRGNIINIENDFLFAILVFGFSILSAYFMNFINGKINKTFL